MPWKYSNRFLYWNESKCIDSEDLCNGINDCYFGSDELFCNLNSTYRKTIVKFFRKIRHNEGSITPTFSFDRLYLFPEIAKENEHQRKSTPSQANIIRNSKLIDDSKLRLLDKHSYRPKCNRGINLLVRERHNDSDYFHEVC